MGTCLKLSAIDFFLKNSLLSWRVKFPTQVDTTSLSPFCGSTILQDGGQKKRRRICKEVVTTIEASPKRTPHYPNKENERRLPRYVAVIILMTIAFKYVLRQKLSLTPSTVILRNLKISQVEPRPITHLHWRIARNDDARADDQGWRTWMQCIIKHYAWACTN